MTFEPGQSGNPNGRPRGIRSRRIVLAEKLFDENAEKLTNLAIRRAEEGDFQALRLCMDRICPRARHGAVGFELPPMTNSSDALAALGAITEGLADADLTLNDAAELAKFVRATSLVAVETNYEERLKKLEETAAEIEKNK